MSNNEHIIAEVKKHLNHDVTYCKWDETSKLFEQFNIRLGDNNDLIDFLSLVESVFTSEKFSNMRNRTLTEALDGKFYHSIIAMILLTQSKIGGIKKIEGDYDAFKLLAINNSYHTDWLLYHLLTQILIDPSEPNLPLPKAFIKSVAISIPDSYHFNNSPFPDDKPELDGKNDSDIFIGRKGITDKFLKFLQGRKYGNKGVYLVTGYRGMGKTSFVNRVLRNYKELKDKDGDYEKGRYKVIDIHINLAQRRPSELDILKLMVSHVRDHIVMIPDTSYLKKLLRKKWIKPAIRTAMIIPVIVISLLLLNSLISERSARETTGQTSKLDKKKSKADPTNLIAFAKNQPGSTINFNIVDKDKEDNAPDFWALRFWHLWYFQGSLGLFIFGLVLDLLLRLYPRLTRYEFEDDLEILYRKCYSSIVTEKVKGNNFSFEQFGAKLNGNGSKDTVSYPLASSKEIEYGLIKFLNQVRHQAEFIFVLDELDKIEPSAISTNYIEEDENSNKQGAYVEQGRERKQAIIDIIAGLKNFLTTAEARFIFIAGHEMFDATLADVADRQSSVGSIFNFVFYVQSFLRESIKEGLNSTGSMGQMIERYIIEMLFPDAEDFSGSTIYQLIKERCFNGDINKVEAIINIGADDIIKLAAVIEKVPALAVVKVDDFITNIHKELIRERKELYFQLSKTIIIIQNFVNYLTYRSNGSPKKIIKTLHEFVRIRRFDKPDNTVLVVSSRVNHFKEQKPYLLFNFKDQYRVGFINHLYRPFIIKYGESFKKYSDNIIISTTYLFDHLLKFHPFAFSFANLELIPEVLSTNKTPSLRDHIITIIEYLSNNHLRETEIGIFDYKFYSRTVNELIYISKTFEEESAAFNFTLDESYFVKLHVRKELKELRKVYSDFSQPMDSLNSAFSITHLNGILGDLHFFDQEYDEAIVAYSNAVNELRYDNKEQSLTDFVLLTRFLLKLGLTFEKIKNYDEALSFYSDAAERAKNFIMLRLEHGKYIGQKNDEDSGKISGRYYTSMLSDLLQIVNQAFIAKIVLQEKMGIEGITALKFGVAVGSFFRLSKKVAEICGRNYLIHSNLYLVLGNLLYFKNSHRGFESEKLEQSGDFNRLINAYEENELVKFFNLRNNYIGGEHTTRVPALSIFYYVIALSEVIRSKYIEADSLNFVFKLKSEEHSIASKFTKNNRARINFYTGNYNYSIVSGNLVKDILGYFNKMKFNQSELFTKNHFKYLAMLTSHIGDCMLSMVKVPDNASDPDQAKGYRNYFLEDIFDGEKAAKFLIDLETNPRESPELASFIKNTEGNDPTIGDVLNCYYQAAHFFRRRGRMVSYSFQLRKILYTLRLVLKDLINTKTDNERILAKEEERGNILTVLEILILRPILQVAGQTTENTDRYMTIKFVHLILEDDRNDLLAKSLKAYIRNNISSHPDSREALTLFMHIQTKSIVMKGDPKLYDEFLNRFSDFVNPYDSYATQYTRIYELGFWAKFNSIRFKKTTTKDVDGKTIKQPGSDEYAREYIFALFSQIQAIEIYGLDYVITHSYKAYIHYHIGKALKNWEESMVPAIENIQKYFGYTFKGSMMDKYYHFSMAKSHYEKALQLHKGGAEYVKNLDNIIYLEDDINDNAYHFGAALDRYLIINGTVDQLIQVCEKEMADVNEVHPYTLNSFVVSE